MPLSNNIETRVKALNLNLKGNARIKQELHEHAKFLKIAPALPVLPVASSSKPTKHSYRSISTAVASLNFEHEETKGYNNITLQQTEERNTVMVARTATEKEKHPDRICLDRQGLTMFPNIVGESKLRLISLQHNLLTKINSCNFTQLTKLVFLDLYDNQIEKICNLEALENLRVLLMGKNRIKKIEGLTQHSKLEVLDLHGNQIQQISGLNGLSSLKVLNLAGNNIKTIGCYDFQGLISLRELNLRRNKIKKLLGFGEIPQLQKLYLSNNDIYKIEDMGNLLKAFEIKEISVDGNPVTLNSEYVSFLVSYLPNLQVLSSMQITEQIRRSATAWRTTKEQSNSTFLDLTAQVCMNVRREEVISNAKTNWELFRSTNKSSSEKGTKKNNTVAYSNIKTHAFNANKFNIVKSKVLNKTKSKGFGSLTSINENVEAAKIQINRRSNSSDNLFKLDDASKAYPLEFKLPPILSSIIDNLMNGKLDGSLSRIDNNLAVLNYVTSVTNSESESSESHESLKGGLRRHLLNLNRRTSSFDSAKQLVCYKSNMTKEKSLSSLTKALIDEKYNYAKLFSKNHKAVKIHKNHNMPFKSGDEFSNKLIFKNILSNQKFKNDYQSKQGIKHNECYSSSSKASSVDSSKSVLSDSSCVSTSRSIPCQDSEQNRHRTKSAQMKKIVHYRNNRAATARAKYRATVTSNPPLQQIPLKEREQGGDYLIEIVGRYLHVFGQGALRFIDRPWDPSKTEDVTIVKFNYVQFNSIATILSKLKNRFPNIEHYIFKETNICHLGQINALTEVQGLTSIQVEPEGNPIISKDWKSYAVFRLAHWGLKMINNKEITDEEIERANEEYAGLVDIVICSLPDSLLQPLLQRLHLERVQKQNGEEVTAKQFLFNSDPALRSVVAKEALQWKKGSVTQEDLIWRHKGKIHLTNLINFTVDAIEKLQILENEWPTILYEIIHRALLDFSEMDIYMKQCKKMLESYK